jgi:hypothetical protein
MTLERHDILPDSPILDWVARERWTDLAWIAAHLPNFHSAASIAYETLGRGAVVVETTYRTQDGGYPVAYLTQDQIARYEDADIDRLIAGYTPEEGLVVILFKDAQRTSAYRLQHLRRFSPAFGQPLQEALQSLLDEPPAPTLSLQWDESRRGWLSRMVFANELPPAVREVFARSGYGCLAVESRRGIVHVCHAADEAIDNFVDQPVEARWDLIELPSAPLVRLELLVYDDPRDPYRSFFSAVFAKKRTLEVKFFNIYCGSNSLSANRGGFGVV